MLRLADLQRKIDEAAEEMRHLTQDDQARRPQHRELRQENLINEDEWYDDFHHGNFAFDDASPLAAELQATPWPPSYKPPQLPMYDGHLDPKQFLMSYEAWRHGEILPSWRNPSSWRLEVWLRHGIPLFS
jgi:Ni/Co efflux regulator RcnB